MQNLQQKLIDQGLVGSLVIRESGAQIPLRFGRGERGKRCKLTLGPVTMDVMLVLEAVDAPEGVANLTLTIRPIDGPTAQEDRRDAYSRAGDAAYHKAIGEGKTVPEAEKLARAAAAATRPAQPVDPTTPIATQEGLAEKLGVLEPGATTDPKLVEKLAETIVQTAEAAGAPVSVPPGVKSEEKPTEKTEEKPVEKTAQTEKSEKLPTESPVSSSTPVPPSNTPKRSGGRTGT